MLPPPNINDIKEQFDAHPKFNWALFDEEWFIYFVAVIEPIFLISVLLPLSKHALLIFIAIGIVIEAVASVIWLQQKSRKPDRIAVLAGIFWAGACVAALFLLSTIGILLYLISIYSLPFLLILIPVSLPCLAYGRLGLKAGRLLSQTEKPARLLGFALAGGAGSILIAALSAGSYYYLRPEIEEIPMFVVASEFESSDWQSWDSGGSIERKGRFFTSASEEEVLNSYKKELERQGWRLLEEDIYFTGLNESLTQLCCYSYWSGNGRQTLLSIGYTQTSKGTLVQINLKKP